MALQSYTYTWPGLSQTIKLQSHSRLHRQTTGTRTHTTGPSHIIISQSPNRQNWHTKTQVDKTVTPSYSPHSCRTIILVHFEPFNATAVLISMVRKMPSRQCKNADKSKFQYSAVHMHFIVIRWDKSNLYFKMLKLYRSSFMLSDSSNYRH